MSAISGYDYGISRSAQSPISIDELRALEQTVGWTEMDRDALRAAGEVLRDQAEAMVESWRAQIGAQPHLAKVLQLALWSRPYARDGLW
jgi:hypothetical protein